MEQLVDLLLDSIHNNAEVSSLELKIASCFPKIINNSNFFQIPVDYMKKILSKTKYRFSENESTILIDKILRNYGIQGLSIIEFIMTDNVIEILQNCIKKHKIYSKKSNQESNTLHAHTADLLSDKNSKIILSPRNQTNTVGKQRIENFVMNRSVQKSENQVDQLTIHKICAFIESGDVISLKSLLSASPNLANLYISDESILHIAARTDYVQINAILIEYGADIESKNRYGSTPIFYAVFKDNIETLNIFLLNGSNIETTNNEGNTPLHWAANCNKIKSAELLLSKGSNPNSRNNHLETPLHLASLSGSLEMVQLLTSMGANITLTDSKGKSPVDIAMNPNIIEFFLSSNK